MATTLNIKDAKGADAGSMEINEAWLEREKGEQAVKDSVVAFMASCRAGTASTKTRGNVEGGGAKPWRQKGNGRARAGSSRSPVWRGGGIAFGPQPRSYDKKVNKKVLQLALKRAFSERVVDGGVVVVDKFALADHKTKSAVAIFKNLKIADGTILLNIAEYDEATCCATGNLQNVALRGADSVNTYDLLLCNKVVFTKDALDTFVGRLA